MPLHPQWCATPDTITAYVGNTPPGVDIILGVDCLDQLDTIIDRSNHTIMFKAKQLLIFLDTFAAIRRRQAPCPSEGLGY